MLKRKIVPRSYHSLVFRRRVAFLLPFLAAAALAGCGGSEAPTAPAPAAPLPLPLPRPGTSRDVYRPPADGRVTPQQVETYIGVLDRVRLDRKAGKAAPPSDPLASEPADVAVARARNVNAEEYLWVKERVLEAEAAAMTVRLNASVLAMLDRTLVDLRARRADAADEGSRKLVSEQIASFEAEAERVRRESREKEPEAVRANMKALEPFRARLGAAHEALDRPLLPPAKEPAKAPAGTP
jgi:hypothetical protein